MSTRREFLKSVAASAVAAASLGAVALPAKAEMMKGMYPPNIVYTADEPGIWAGKEGTHAPQVDVEGMKVSVLTSHPMSEEHYIVRHTLVSEKGDVIGAALFTPADMPLSEYTVPGPGTYYATSFCNKHDFWLTKFTV